MGLFDIDINDKDLTVIERIVERICKSIDGVAVSFNEIAKAIREKKITVG